MPNSTMRHKTEPEHFSLEREKSIRTDTERMWNSTQRSNSFFEKMNKTIINQNKNQIRKRNLSRSSEICSEEKMRKIFKTPAMIQEVVEIVNQKKIYHRLRNMGKGNKCAFEFNMDNVPAFIKKKYGHVLDPKKIK